MIIHDVTEDEYLVLWTAEIADGLRRGVLFRGRDGKPAIFDDEDPGLAAAKKKKKEKIRATSCSST